MTEPDRRKQICRGCSERPAGCWRAVEYGCQNKFRAAEQHAADTGECPIGKLTSRVMIGLFTAPKFWKRLQLCQETWLIDARTAGQQFRIVCTERHDGPEWLHSDVPDKLSALPQQVRAWCQWALERNGWDYLFKCDDDTYVSIPRFMAYDTAGRDYIGGWCRYGGETYAHGGAGYFLSRKAAAIVAERMRHEEGPEDLLVGRVLREAGIQCSFDRSFMGWARITYRPFYGNDAITAHTKRAEVFRACYAETGFNAQPGPAPERSHDRASRLRAERRAILRR